MGKPEFDITIGKDGQVKIKVHGVSGKECIAITDMLKQIVGKEESRHLTAEYYGSPGNVRIDTHVETRTQSG
ncbi:MAG TPA: DUF2997 domain-containing protein [Candidatus Bathyarchaeia archaeon]|nr:DUF2997 domain-containing protein [Candidatus Bathyarchaeia archaeon]